MHSTLLETEETQRRLLRPTVLLLEVRLFPVLPDKAVTVSSLQLLELLPEGSCLSVLPSVSLLPLHWLPGKHVSKLKQEKTRLPIPASDMGI